MRKFDWIGTVTLLEVIALEIGLYTYAALEFHERMHVLEEIILLAVIGLIVGTIVTRFSSRLRAYVVLIAGLISLSIGYYFLYDLGYHERASAALGTGLICIIGGCAGLAISRSVAASLLGLIILGLAIFCIGFYLLIGLSYHGRAYMVLATGALCLIIGSIGFFLSQRRPHGQERLQRVGR